MATTEAVTNADAVVRVDSRLRLVIGLYVATALAGSTQALSVNALVYYLSSLLLACCATGWCVVDARQRGKPMLPIVKLLCLIFWTIAVPIYLIGSRGWRGAGWLLLHSIAMTLVFLVAFYAAQYAVWGPI
jgi:hypothetical protein